MALTPRKLAADEREALRLLAGSPDGCTEALRMAHGFAIGMLRDLVRDGLAASEHRAMRAGRRPMQVEWLVITAEGRKALAG